MKNIMRCRLSSVAVVVGLILSTLSLQAEIEITNVELTDTTLSFDVAGSIDVVGAFGSNQLFVGELGNTAWVNGYYAGVWSDDGGTITMTGAEVNSLSVGDYAVVSGPSSMTIGDTVQGSFAITGSFNSSLTDTTSWVAAAGFTQSEFEALPDPETVTGGFVPEPSSGLFACVLAAGLLKRRRR